MEEEKDSSRFMVLIYTLDLEGRLVQAFGNRDVSRTGEDLEFTVDTAQSTRCTSVERILDQILSSMKSARKSKPPKERWEEMLRRIQDVFDKRCKP